MVWKFCANRPKVCGNCAFPQNFHTMKLSEITVFYAVDITKIPKKSLRNCPFFSDSTALQLRISGFSKCKLQEKYFLWLFWNSWKFARERYIMKSFDQLNASKKNFSYIFERMLGKLLLWTFRKNIKKTSLVAFFKKNSSSPIYYL